MRIKNIRFKSDNPEKWYREISDVVGIKEIEKLPKRIRVDIILALVKSLESYSGISVFRESYERFEERTMLYFNINNVRYFSHDEVLNINLYEEEIKKALLNIYNKLILYYPNSNSNGNYVGKLVEYFSVRLINSNVNRIYIEHRLFHKRRCIQTLDSTIKNKVVDITEVSNDKLKYNFYECKANLHSEYSRLIHGKNTRLKHKMRLMKHLKRKITEDFEENTSSKIAMITLIKPNNVQQLPRLWQREVEIIDFEKLHDIYILR